MISSRALKLVAGHTRFQWKTISNRLPLPTPPCAIAAAAAPPRFYSSSRLVCKKGGDDDDGDEYGDIQIVGGELTEEEARRIIDEEIELMERLERSKYVENWKPGMRKRKLVIHHDLEEMEREMYPDRFAPPWTLRDRRCGALAIKVGMMPLWDPQWGERIPCTVLFVDANVVLGHKTLDRHGYSAVQIAAGERKKKNLKSTVLGQYRELLQEDRDRDHPPYLVREFRVTDEALLPPVFSPIHARHFVPGQNVDIAGITKGKGFQGGMKLHGFSGMPASHGVSTTHRHIGSTGSCQDPGRVWKGKKMPGRMGSDRVTIQNLRIVKIDRGRNLIFVKGHVPGQKGNWVEIRDAVKRPLWNTDLVEGGLDRPPLPTYDYAQDLLEGEGIDGSGLLGHEVFMPSSKEDPLDPDYRNTLIQLKADE